MMSMNIGGHRHLYEVLVKSSQNYEVLKRGWASILRGAMRDMIRAHPSLIFLYSIICLSPCDLDRVDGEEIFKDFKKH